MTKLEQNPNQKATHNSEKARALEFDQVGNKAQLHHNLAVWPWGNVLPSLDLKSSNGGGWGRTTHPLPYENSCLQIGHQETG